MVAESKQQLGSNSNQGCVLPTLAYLSLGAADVINPLSHTNTSNGKNVLETILPAVSSYVYLPTQIYQPPIDPIGLCHWLHSRSTGNKQSGPSPASMIGPQFRHHHPHHLLTTTPPPTPTPVRKKKPASKRQPGGVGDGEAHDICPAFECQDLEDCEDCCTDVVERDPSVELCRIGVELTCAWHAVTACRWHPQCSCARPLATAE